MSSLSSPLQAVIDVFSGPLDGVRFADIDGDGLAALATEVETLNSEVELHEARLAELREALAQKQESLLALAQQALAYARIYAESDEALSATLNEIALPRAAKPRKASPKATSERPAKTAKDDADTEASAETTTPTPSKRKTASAAAEAKTPTTTEPEAEQVAAGKTGRRKLPTRRASR